jgi:cytochrome c biogenesis protein CcdA
MSSSLGARPIEVLLVEDNAGDIRLLTVMFCVGVAVMLWHLSHLSSTLVESGAFTRDFTLFSITYRAAYLL